MQRSVGYTLLFATLVCVACAIVVSSLAVGLKEKQEVNKLLDKKKNVLQAAGLLQQDEKISAEEVEERFSNIDLIAIDLETGLEAPEIDISTYDQRKAAKDPGLSSEAPDNMAGVKRIPSYASVFELRDESGSLEMVILPIEGYGLWGTLYGFLALDSDLETIRGITFYEHKETPGLGGEVDNPSWKAKWDGRLAFGDDGSAQIEVAKGPVGPPSEAPYSVDGLSGATITGRGVTNLLHFWLGENGFAPYLDRLSGQSERSAA